MNGEILLLFVILLLALVLCSFLGGSNCSTKEGFTTSNINGTYNGPNGETAIVTDNSIIFTTNGNVITLTQNTTNQTYTSPNGATATFDSSGNLIIKDNQGNTTAFPPSSNINGTYTGPNGQTAVVSDNSIVFTTNGNVITLTENTYSQTYTGPNGTTATFDSSGNLTITDNQGNTVITTNPSTTNPSTTNSSTTNSSTTSSTASSSNYDNYNHYNGSSYPTIYYGPNGSTARVINVDGQGKIVITNANGTTSIYYINNTGSSSSSSSSSSSTNVYNGPNGGTAIITTDSSGNQNVQITMPNGSQVIYTPTNTYVSNSIDPTVNQTTTTGSNGGQVTTVSGPSGNTAYAATGPNGASTVGTSNTYDSSAYYNSLPTGIPASQIPSGQEDLYILKSQVVPPVCPKCPDPILGSSSSFDSSKCPACPPCARCPEPAFDCKKVPNYNAFNPDYMPVPVLSDFSSFGM